MTEQISTTTDSPDSSRIQIETTTVDPPSRPLELTDRFYGCDVLFQEDPGSGTVVRRHFDTEDNLPAKKVLCSTGYLACTRCELPDKPYTITTEGLDDGFHSDIEMRRIHGKDREVESVELSQEAGRRCYAFHNCGHMDDAESS